MKRTHLSIGGVVLIIALVAVVLLLQKPSGSTPAATGNPAGAPAQPGSASQPKPAAGGASAGGVSYDPSLAKFLPDPQKTPGDTLDVTPKDFCVSGYTAKVRDVPDAEKNQVYAEYGITSHAPGSYEVDHLISLELGGSNSIKNLWPQSYTGEWNAHQKDNLENKLHDLVCAGTLDMKAAQQMISTNWIATYQKYVK